jgi:hypothetical protein
VVPLKIYSHRVDEQANAANKGMTDALGVQDTRRDSERGDEETMTVSGQS